jgi:hypothetical protein
MIASYSNLTLIPWVTGALLTPWDLILLKCVLCHMPGRQMFWITRISFAMLPLYAPAVSRAYVFFVLFFSQSYWFLIRPMGRPRCRWVDNIKMDLREIGWDGVDWIDMAQDRDQWRALVNTVLNLRVPWNAGKFLGGCTIGGSSRKALSFWLSHQYPICIPLLPIRATCHAHIILLDLIMARWVESDTDEPFQLRNLM